MFLMGPLLIMRYYVIQPRAGFSLMGFIYERLLQRITNRLGESLRRRRDLATMILPLSTYSEIISHILA